jgi:predicted DNA-binding transcriptional regulator AlpA
MSDHKPYQQNLKHFLLDRRAHQIIFLTEEIPDDQLVSTPQLAVLMSVSVQTLELWRTLGEGPKYKKLSPRCVRYQMSDVRVWLKLRARISTKKTKAA